MYEGGEIEGENVSGGKGEEAGGSARNNGRVPTRAGSGETARVERVAERSADVADRAGGEVGDVLLRDGRPVDEEG